MNHAMLAVGFGVENGTEFVTIKNSWDTVWGESGYIRVALVSGSDGVC